MTAAAECTRLRRGFLQYELEHKRVGSNVWVRVWCEAGRGELLMWRGEDVVQYGITPTTEPLRALKLSGAKVGLTKSPRKEEPHSFRVTLSLLAVASGGAAGDAKHVLAVSDADALGEWMGTLQANIDLCALPVEDQEALIAQDERNADAEELQERLTGIAQLCIGLCAAVCSLASACCESCQGVHGIPNDNAPGPRRKYHAVSPLGTKGADGTEGESGDAEAAGIGSGTSVALGVYICRKKQSIRETVDKSSRIVGIVEEGARVEVFEEQPATVGTGHARLRLAEGWVDSGSGAILEGSKPMFVYFEKESGSVLSSLRRRP